MNSEQREALVETVAGMIGSYHAAMKGWERIGGNKPSAEHVSAKVVALINDRMRRMPWSPSDDYQFGYDAGYQAAIANGSSPSEPDEDAVERAAKAIHACHKPMLGAIPPWDEELDVWKDTYRNFARAALQAAGTDADEPDLSVIYMKGYQDGQDAEWLDAAFDSVRMNVVAVHRMDAGWFADMSYEEGHVGGKGDSPTSAVLDAVEAARKESGDE